LRAHFFSRTLLVIFLFRFHAVITYWFLSVLFSLGCDSNIHIRVDPDEMVKVSVGTASLLDYLSSLDAGNMTASSTGKEHDGSTTASKMMNTTEYSFCLGADAFMDLTNGKWKESARVLQFFAAHKLVVLHRQTCTSASIAGTSATTNEATKKNSDNSLLEGRVCETGARLIQVSHLGSISSSQVRECSSLSDLATMVGPDVAAYIQTHRLYQFANVNES
jgi:hypothetical protein